MPKTNSFMKPLTVSAELAEVVGAGPMPRSEVVKKLWAYIKKNKLQDQVTSMGRAFIVPPLFGLKAAW